MRTILHKIHFCLLHLLYLPFTLQFRLCASSAQALISADLARSEYPNHLAEALHFDLPFRSVYFSRVKSRPCTGFLKFFCKPLPQIEIAVVGDIGGGLKINHNLGCVISAKSVGDNLTILQGATIGKGHQTPNGVKPIIGNNVFVGANAVVIGGIVIGDGAVIGAGSVVNKDVPSNAVVAGVPARVLYYRDAE